MRPLEIQPPSENYGVRVMPSHGVWIVGYKPFDFGSAWWGLCESPFGDSEPSIVQCDGVWYWVG